jgi:hypothetical protein
MSTDAIPLRDFDNTWDRIITGIGFAPRSSNEISDRDAEFATRLIELLRSDDRAQRDQGLLLFRSLEVAGVFAVLVAYGWTFTYSAGSMCFRFVKSMAVTTIPAASWCKADRVVATARFDLDVEEPLGPGWREIITDLAREEESRALIEVHRYSMLTTPDGRWS